MQEESSVRKERARQATEEQIQSQQRQTERERAEIERETIRVKAMAEAEGRAHEAKLTEEHNRRMLIERLQGERDKWLAAINTTFSHIEGMQLISFWPLWWIIDLDCLVCTVLLIPICKCDKSHYQYTNFWLVSS